MMAAAPAAREGGLGLVNGRRSPSGLGLVVFVVEEVHG